MDIQTMIGATKKDGWRFVARYSGYPQVFIKN